MLFQEKKETINITEFIKQNKVGYRLVGDTTGEWSISDCSECYIGELIRDHLYDMEFIVFDKEGRKLYNTASNSYPRPDNTEQGRFI